MKPGILLRAAALAAAASFAACPPPVTPEQKVPVPATVVLFAASQSLVAPGTTVVLAWEVKDAQSIALTTAAGEPIAIPNASAATGSVDLTIEEDSLFVLTARGEGGSDSRTAAVAVAEDTSAFLFTAFPRDVVAGESVALVWNAPGASEVSIQDAAGVVHTSQSTSGTHVVHPDASTTYTLTAGARTASVDVTVGPKVFAFAPSAPSAPPGTSIALNWRVGGATEVAVSAEGRGVLHTEVDPAKIADGTFEDVLPLDVSHDDGIARYLLTARNGAVEVTAQATVYVGADPAITRFAVPPYGREGFTFPITWSTLEADEVTISFDGVPVYEAQSRAEILNGTWFAPTPQAATEVTLTARNARGGSVLRTATVAPVGTTTFQSFTVTPTTVTAAGDSALLEWNVPNARHVRITLPGTHLLYEITGTAAETGSLPVYPNAPTTYLLEADNTIGDFITPATATAEATARATLTFSPGSMPYGGQQQLTGASMAGDLVARNFAVKNDPNEAFEDIAATGTSVGFSISTSAQLKQVNLGSPFQMDLFDRRFVTDTLAVTTRGWISLDPNVTSTSTAPNEWSSIPLPAYAIAPYLEIIQQDDQADVLWDRIGTGASERLIVQWENIRYSSTETKRLTFQVQLHASGKVVFAYKSIAGLATGDIPSIGIVRPGGQFVVAPFARQLAGGRPVDGDTFTFFSTVPLPLEVGAYPDEYLVDLKLSSGGAVVISQSPGVIVPGDFWISEVNPFPGTGAPEGEWIELTNATGKSYDLSGWQLELSGGLTHTLSPSAALVLPANGTLLLAASGDPAQNGGLTPDYVYGSGLPLGDTAGFVRIGMPGLEYDTATWGATSGQAQGVSVRFDPVLLDHKFVTGTAQSTCAGTGTYGTQTGSPDARIPGCFPYRMAALPQGNFESIALTGTKINPTTPVNEFLVALNYPATLPAPIKMGNNTYNRIYVGDNGFVALRDQAEPTLACVSATSCYNSNKSSVTTATPTRLAAPFWDTLSGNQAASGMYLERKDPDSTVTGDEYTIVSWESWNWSTSTTSVYDLNFQVKFFDDGDIEYHYGTMTGPTQTNANGNSATIWLESHDARTALVWNITTTWGPGVHTGEGIRYQFVP